MKLLVALVVAGVATAVVAGERIFLQGIGQCAMTVPKSETFSCRISYLLIDDTFKITINVRDGGEPAIIEATMKREGPELVSVYDAQGENKVGVGEHKDGRIVLDFSWSPGVGAQGVSLTKQFGNILTGDGLDDLPMIDLSGSLTHPLFGAEPYLTFKGILAINVNKTSCLMFGKEPVDCDL